jgi:hypothetical protein
MPLGILQKSAALLAAAILCASGPAFGSTIFSFATGGSDSTNSGTSFGNVRTFTEDSQTVTVTAWSDTARTPANAFAAAFLGQYSTGLGVCNRSEASVAGSLGACASDGGVRDQVDNVGNQDLVLFRFDTPQVFESITIDPHGAFDRDLSYWVGNIPGPFSLGGLTFADLTGLGFGAQQDSFNGVGEEPLTVGLGDATGNVLLIGALVPANGDNDKFKISTLATSESAVPLPGTIGLFLAGFGLLLGRVRRRISC